MISKTIQNELLNSVRKYILECINKEINEEGTPYFGVVADEVTDCANWEQLGIIIRHVYQQKPVDGLIEYVKRNNIRGETIANLIIKSLKSNGIFILLFSDLRWCRIFGRKAKRSSSRFKKKLIVIEHYIITVPLTN